jgi:hypothetical protein
MAAGDARKLEETHTQHRVTAALSRGLVLFGPTALAGRSVAGVSHCPEV